MQNQARARQLLRTQPPAPPPLQAPHLEVAPLVLVDAQGLRQAVLRAQEAHGQQHQVRLQQLGGGQGATHGQLDMGRGSTYDVKKNAQGECTAPAAAAPAARAPTHTCVLLGTSTSFLRPGLSGSSSNLGDSV